MVRKRRPWGVASALLAVGLPISVALTSAPVALAGADTTPPAPFDFVEDFVSHYGNGHFQHGFDVASPYLIVGFAWTKTTDDSGSLKYLVAVDGSVEKKVDQPGPNSGPIIEQSLTLTEGTHVLTITAVDSAKNERSATHELNVVVDHHDPVFESGPTLTFRKGPVSVDSVPLEFSWQVVDEGTGISQLLVGRGSCCLVPVDSTSYDFTLPFKHRRSWQVKAWDGVGNITKQARSTYVSALPPRQFARAGDWQRRRSSGDLGVASRWTSDQRGSQVRFTTNARSAAWVATSGQGAARPTSSSMVTWSTR